MDPGRKSAATGRLSRFSRLGNAQKGAENTSAADKWEGSGGRCQTKPASTTRTLLRGSLSPGKTSVSSFNQKGRWPGLLSLSLATRTSSDRLFVHLQPCASPLLVSSSPPLSLCFIQPAGSPSCHELGMGSSLNQVSTSERVSFRAGLSKVPALSRVEIEISTSTLATYSWLVVGTFKRYSI